MTYEKPSYMVTDLDAIDRKCERCRHLLGIDYGRRFEVVSADRLKILHIITTQYGGRCPECFTYFDWHPCRRKNGLTASHI
jgi:hypothetical protein